MIRAVDFRRIAELRTEAGLTQEELAERIGMKRQTISGLESGSNVNPTVSTLQAVLHACGSSLAEFFESKIPETYEDPRHQELHEKLQSAIGKGSPDQVRMIESLIDAVLSDYADH